jgi:hypothetical protein
MNTLISSGDAGPGACGKTAGLYGAAAGRLDGDPEGRLRSACHGGPGGRASRVAQNIEGANGAAAGACEAREAFAGAWAQAASNTSRAQVLQAPQDDATRVSSWRISKQRVPERTARAMSRSETRWHRQTIMARGAPEGNAAQINRNANDSQ